MFCKSNFRLWLLVVLINNIYSGNLNNTNLNNSEKKIVESKKVTKNFHHHEKIQHKDNKKTNFKKSKFPTNFNFTKSSNLKGKEIQKENLYKIKNLEEQIKCRLHRGEIIHKPEANSTKKDFGFCTKEVDIPLAKLTKKVVIKKNIK